MSWTYFKFLFVNTVKRKSIWITWLLFLFTCTCFIIILPAVIEMNTLQVWANTTMAFCQSFMGMIAALYTAVLAINIFKDTNEEGTELIVISKPISRMKLVITKFILFGFFCLMVNISTVILSSFTIFLPKTEPEFYVGLLVSMFIGNAITFATFGSISILLTVKFAKMGVIITNMILTLVFMIYQTLTLFVFSTPLKALDDRYMSAASYIIHERDLNNLSDGAYKENEVVKFTPSAPPQGKPHPCKDIVDWTGLQTFWEEEIKKVDPSTILSATDLASQISLTYMTYKTNDFAARQAQRMFAISRFYDYKLTSPASPELLLDEEHHTLPWMYTGILYLQYEDLDFPIVLPSSFGFDGIEPLTSTRLRGYDKRIPVGTLRSKESLLSNEVFFEQEQWQKYSIPFDIMYTDVFDYRNYEDVCPIYDILDQPYLFATDNAALERYYQIVWACFTGHSQDYLKFPSEISQYSSSYFDIKNVNDLNERFIQFKNYVYWKALQEQKNILYNASELEQERVAKDAVINTIIQEYPLLLEVLGVQFSPNNWMCRDISEQGIGILDPNSQAPGFIIMTLVVSTLKETLPPEQFNAIAPKLSLPRTIKTMKLFEYVVNNAENYLFTELDKPTRTNKMTGRAYSTQDTWLPNIHGVLSEALKIDLPLGQNLQYFFYTTTPKVNYWVYTLVWGLFSLMLFCGGAIVYNKYDVK